jgi:hypothetical protein
MADKGPVYDTTDLPADELAVAFGAEDGLSCEKLAGTARPGSEKSGSRRSSSPAGESSGRDVGWNGFPCGAAIPWSNRAFRTVALLTCKKRLMLLVDRSE